MSRHERRTKISILANSAESLGNSSVSRNIPPKVNSVEERIPPLTSIFLIKYLKKTEVSKESIAMVLIDETQEIISRLKFIGRIKKGEKICVRGVYTEPDNILTNIVRTTRGWVSIPEDRCDALKFIKVNVNLGLKISNELLSSGSPMDKMIAEGIYTDLMNAVEGIANFKDTYSKDSSFCCEVDTFVQYTNFSIKELEKRMNEMNHVNDHIQNHNISQE